MMPDGVRINTRGPSESSRDIAVSWSTTRVAIAPGRASGEASRRRRRSVGLRSRPRPASGASARTLAKSPVVPRRTSTPTRSHWPIRQSARSPISARPGRSSARRILPPSARAALEQRDAMAAGRRDPRRLEPGRSAATDDHDALAPRRSLELVAELGLAADRRVRHAGDRQPLGQVAVAALIDAGAARGSRGSSRLAPSPATPGRR